MYLDTAITDGYRQAGDLNRLSAESGLQLVAVLAVADKLPRDERGQIDFGAALAWLAANRAATPMTGTLHAVTPANGTINF